MELVQNRSFTFTTSNSLWSRLWHLRNGAHRDQSWHPSYLTSIYTHDTNNNFQKICIYADDLAIMHSALKWQALRGHSKSTHGNPIHIFTVQWKLKFSITKTVTTAFHIYNKEAWRKLNIAVEGRSLPFCPKPTYLGIKLDRSLIYHQHLESLSNDSLC